MLTKGVLCNKQTLPESRNVSIMLAPCMHVPAALPFGAAYPIPMDALPQTVKSREHENGIGGN